MDPGGAPHSVEETTEVHVSIGRIEVTAVSEPQPKASRRRPPEPKAMSLEEYLARRMGERR